MRDSTGKYVGLTPYEAPVMRFVASGGGRIVALSGELNAFNEYAADWNVAGAADGVLGAFDVFDGDVSWNGEGSASGGLGMFGEHTTGWNVGGTASGVFDAFDAFDVYDNASWSVAGSAGGGPGAFVESPGEPVGWNDD